MSRKIKLKDENRLSCPVCKLEELAVKKYSTRHGHSYGWQLNCPVDGKFLIVNTEKRRTPMTPGEIFKIILAHYKQETPVQNYETFKAYMDDVVETGRELLTQEGYFK